MAAISPPHKLLVWQSVRANYAIVPRNLGQLARIVIFQCHENLLRCMSRLLHKGEAVDAAAISSGM